MKVCLAESVRARDRASCKHSKTMVWKNIRFSLCGSRNRYYIKAQYKEKLGSKLFQVGCTDIVGDELLVTDGVTDEAKLPAETRERTLATMTG